MQADATLEAFVDLFARVNPFLENRVTGAAPAAIDVTAIHRGAFERLVALAKQAGTSQRGLGVVVSSEAGVGKSHLLARLARWAEEGNAWFIGLHDLQASPESLPRSVLHGVVSRLTWGRRNRFHPTPLYELARAGLLEAAGGEGHYGWRQLEKAFNRWLDEEGPAIGDRLVYESLFLFFRSATAAMRGKEDGSVADLIVRWLGGGGLDPVEARLALLPPAPRRDDTVALADGRQITEALGALTRLARAQGRPVILALDQVENLNESQFASLARFLEALLDFAPNLLVITAAAQAALARWYSGRTVQPGAWDRFAQFEVRLTRLVPEQAELLLRGRLEAFLAPFLFCEELTKYNHPASLFPLGGLWARQAIFSRGEARPRDVINLARERWQAQQSALARLGPAAWLEGWPGDQTEAPPPSGEESWSRPARPPGEAFGSTDTVSNERAGETSHGDVVVEQAEE